MKILIAVATCHKHRTLADAQRATWAHDVQGADVKFFLGGGQAQRPDEVILDAPDDYPGLPKKCTAIFKYAIEHDYDYVFKTDSDVYLRPERLLKALPPKGKHYVGRYRGAAGAKDRTGQRLPAAYCSGFAYWLSRQGMIARANGDDSIHHCEDIVTGNILLLRRMLGEKEPRFVVARSKKNLVSNVKEGPRKGNDIIASCEYDAQEMMTIHQEFLTTPSAMGNFKIPTGTPFDRVDIMMKTFLRDGFMMNATNAIDKHLAGARIVLVDDGYESAKKLQHYEAMVEMGHAVIQTTFDSGYGAKNNLAVSKYERPYILRVADDFDFATPGAAEGVMKLIDVLDSDPSVGIASGRFDNIPYEHTTTITERPDGLVDVRADLLKDPVMLKASGGAEYAYCDFTVNYSLIRREVMDTMVWDEQFKIGGDHLDLYLHNAKLGKKTAWVKGVNIDSQPLFAGATHGDYHLYRGRARLALPHTFKRHGWASFTSSDGRVDTIESVTKWAEEHPFNPAKGIKTQAKPGEKMSLRERQLLMRERVNKSVDEKKRKEALNACGPYRIRKGYVHRDEVPHYDDTQTEGEWQVEVYELARNLYTERGLKSVLDIGCGNADKLIQHFAGEKFTGMEVEPTLSWLKENREGHFVDTNDMIESHDLIICSDVIEHVQRPDLLLERIRKLGPKLVVISTPDRTLVPGTQTGPPRNPHHIREWEMNEFGAFLTDHGFNVIDHHICNREQATQVAVCYAQEGM